MFHVPQHLGVSTDMHLHYSTHRVIGKGAKGTVRIVADKSGREFACKTILKNETTAREIAALQAMQGCSHVAQLHQVFEDNVAVHIITQLCRGGDLNGRIFEEIHTQQLMRNVLCAIDAVHAAGMVHRDIKPANFVLLESHVLTELKLVDFGLAVRPPIKEGLMQGTLWYMAPEIFASNVGKPADVWAAGVMTAELLTGKMPFDDKRNLRCPEKYAIIRSILKGKYTYEGSDSCREFIAAMLTPDPKNRPPARHMLEHPWVNKV